MYKKLLIVAALIGVVAGSVNLTNVSALHKPDHTTGGGKQDLLADDGDTKKVAFCHATGSNTNPYVYIEASVNAFFKAGHDTHQDNEDIVPAFSYTKQGQIINFKGLNWTATSAAFIQNKCENKVTPPIATADIKANVICEAVNKRAVITLTNTGLASGDASLTIGANSPKTISVNAGAQVIEYATIPTGGTLIKVESNSKTLFEDSKYTCEGGQGNATPVVEEKSPLSPAGESAITTDTTTSIASLPYTAGSNKQQIALIAASIAAFVILAGTIIKKAYLKQI